MPDQSALRNPVSPKKIYPFLLAFLLSIVAAGILDNQVPGGAPKPEAVAADPGEFLAVWVGVENSSEFTALEYRIVFDSWCNSGVRGVILPLDSIFATQQLVQAAKIAGLSVVNCDMSGRALKPSDFAPFLTGYQNAEQALKFQNIGGQSPRELQAGLNRAFDRRLGTIFYLRERELTASHLAVVSHYFRK